MIESVTHYSTCGISGQETPESAGYTLITPDPARFREATDTFLRLQNSSYSRCAYIPAGFGMLIFPDKKHMVLSYHPGSGQIFEIPPLEKEISELETDMVRSCGVTTFSHAGYVFLAHGYDPGILKPLTARGLDLARKNGAVLDTPVPMSVFWNPRFSISGPSGYLNQIGTLEDDLEIPMTICPSAVHHRDTITITNGQSQARVEENTNTTLFM